MDRLEVTAEIEIAAEPTDVAGVMFDPHREPEWLSAVESVEVIDAGIKPGARVRHVIVVNGRQVALTTEVAQFQFPHALMLRVADGPVSGDVAYHVLRAGTGSLARVRGRLEAQADPAAAPAMRDRLAADLQRLKTLVEGGPGA